MILQFNFTPNKGSFGFRNFLVLPLFVLFLFFSVNIHAQVVFFTEGFETDGEGIRYTSNTYTDCSLSDFFFRTNTQGFRRQCVTE